tara:strand:+ start:341 stop:1171 length:831 start_codon:yes stop_codon:yes gene_type:complete
MFLRFVLIVGIVISLISCSKKETIYKPTEIVDPFQLYKEGLEAFDKRQYFFAEKKFSQAELNFNKVDLSAKSALMASFSLYAINFYEKAIDSLNRYIKSYPGDKNIMYAHYLSAIIYFEQISDEKKDVEPLLIANKKIDFFLEKFPDTDYAIDLKFKKELIVNQLAAKELFVAKYYISVQKWAAAVKRLKNIIVKYDETIFVEEALHRLVEIYYHLGAEEEAKNYAAVLGYNYNSSEWFKQSYKILNKDYRIPKKKKLKKKKKDENFLKKIIKKIT